LLDEKEGILSQAFLDEMTERVEPCLDTFAALNTKEKDTSPTETDVYHLLQHALSEDDPYDELLSRAMQTGAALLTCSAQLRAMRVVFRNPEYYATHVQSDVPEATNFKTTKTVASLQLMLNHLLVRTPATPSRPHSLRTQLTNPTATSTSRSTSQLLSPSNPSTLPTDTTRRPDNAMLDMMLKMQQQLMQLQSKPQTG